MRAICSHTASTSGRASGVERIWTSQPGCTPTDRSTSRRAYSSMRGSRTFFFYSDFVLFTTVSGGQRSQEVLDLERRQGLDAGRAARTERDRDLSDRLDVGRLDDVHEVEGPERRPLVEDLRAELLDVLVDLAQPLRIRLERLDALLTQRRQEDEDRHCPGSLLWRPGRRRAAPHRGREAG